MKDWQNKARETVLAAAYGDDPEAVPVYLIPKPRPWWALWRKTEWEEIQGVSRAQMQRVADAMARFPSPAA